MRKSYSICRRCQEKLVESKVIETLSEKCEFSVLPLNDDPTITYSHSHVSVLSHHLSKPQPELYNGKHYPSSV